MCKRSAACPCSAPVSCWQDFLRKRPSVGVLDQRRARAIRGLEIIAKLAAVLEVEPVDRRRWRQIEEGAVLQRDGVIAEIGPPPS
jgi:hypothetical protein